jgi:hypothetical protein
MSRSVIDQIRDELVTGVDRYEVRRRRVRAASVAAVVAVVIAAGTVAWNADNTGSKVQVQSDPDTTTTTQPAPQLEAGPLPGLQRLPSPPGNAMLTAPVSIGGAILFVVQLIDYGPFDAFAYNVETRAWRRIADAPSNIGNVATKIWTGRELFVCCGALPSGGEGAGAAAAYDPTTDAWRVLPDAPVHGYATSVWTGTDVIVVAPDGVASFDPDRETWTMLPALPALETFNESVWTGDYLVVWPAPGSRTVHAGQAYNPRTRTWLPLSAPPEQSWPAMLDIAWVDDALVIVGGLPAAGDGSERLVGARFDPTTRNWTPMPDPLPEPDGCECNLGSQTTLWTGKELLMHVGALASGLSADGALFAYDTAQDAWQLIGDTKETALVPVAMAGSRVLLQRDGDYFLSEPGWSPTGFHAP